MNALFHPRVALASEFLGYSQPRVTAPFSYPNTWGNAFGLMIPFFIVAWFGKTAGWRRWVGPFILLASVDPGRLLPQPRTLAGLGRLGCVGGAQTPDGGRLPGPRCGRRRCRPDRWRPVVDSPRHPRSPCRSARRTATSAARTPPARCFRTTWEASPMLGYGSTRQKTGNFNSLAGGGVPGCHQCSAPPLGHPGIPVGPGVHDRVRRGDLDAVVPAVAVPT